MSAKQNQNLQLDADLPYGKPDAFKLDHFAKFVLSTIKGCPNGSSFVVGVEGQWGSGKTFVFKQIKSSIEEQQKPNAELGITTLDYEPWLVSGKHAIVQELLRALSRHLLTANTLRSGGEKVAKLIGQFAGALGATGSLALGGIDFGLIAMLSRDVSKKAKHAENFLKPNESPQHLKSEIVTALSSVDEKIVVFIDDIDRLPPAEIRDLFQAIKSVADFPNVIYVLGYDRAIVTKSLSDKVSDFDGEHYLEKIVQLPMPLPKIGERERVVYLEQQLVLLDYDFSKSEGERVRGVLIAGGQLIKTPRMAIRLCNSLRMLKHQLDGEVDAVDLLAIELLRFCEPDLWKRIHDQTKLYTGMTLTTDFQDGVEYRERPQEHAAQQGLDRDANPAQADAQAVIKTFCSAAQSLHRLLFPDAFDDNRYSRQNYYSKALRLANPDRLAYYLSQASTPWVYPIKYLQTFVTPEGLKNYFQEEKGDYFGFKQRAKAALDVLSELPFSEPQLLLEQVASQLAKFKPEELVKNNRQSLGYSAEHVLVDEIILALLKQNLNFSADELANLLESLPFSYVCHFQSWSSNARLKKAKNTPSTMGANHIALHNELRYQTALNHAFLAMMRSGDAPQKLIAYGESVANNFYYFAELTSLQEARTLFNRYCLSLDFLKYLAGQRDDHREYSTRVFKFIDNFDSFISFYTKWDASDSAVTEYLEYLNKDETKQVWSNEFAKGLAGAE